MTKQDSIILAMFFIPGTALAVLSLLGESIYSTSQCGTLFAPCTDGLVYFLIFFLTGLGVAAFLTHRYLSQLQVINIKKVIFIGAIHLIILSIPLGIAGLRFSLFSLVGYPLIYFVYYFLFNKLSPERQTIYSILFFIGTMALAMAVAGRP